MVDLVERDRSELLDALAVHTARDPYPFVSAPIVVPTDRFFPDPWAPTEAALDAIAQRLLALAGLGHFTASVALGEGAIDAQSLLPKTHIDLAGVESGSVLFAVAHLGRPEDAVLALAHEVARAALLVRHANPESYRRSALEGLLTPDDTEEEGRAASILGVHLGFGVLGAIGSHVFRQIGRMEASVGVTERQHVSYGGLAPKETSYLLAVHLCVRSVEGRELEEIFDALPADRGAEVRAELRKLRREELVERLGLPPPRDWPTTRPPDAPPASRTREGKAARRGGVASDAIVFRVLTDYAGSGGCLGMLAGLGLVLLLPLLASTLPVRVVPNVSREAVHLFIFSLPILVGFLVGRARARDKCSTCLAPIPSTAKRCPGCAGRVVGRLPHRNHRLAAEEKYRKKQRAKARAAVPSGPG